MKPIQYITVACAHCEKRHKVLPKMVGNVAACKRCGENFEVRPKEAVADPIRKSQFEPTQPSDQEREYYIPVSLTSSPMIDDEYNKESRAQTTFTTFQKLPDKAPSAYRNAIIFAAIFAALAVAAFLAYWFLIRN